jgi:hypothetical protein
MVLTALACRAGDRIDREKIDDRPRNGQGRRDRALVRSPAIGALRGLPEGIASSG